MNDFLSFGVISGFIIMCLFFTFLSYRNKVIYLKAKNESLIFRNKDLESKLMKSQYKSDNQDKKELKLLQEYQEKINNLELQIEDYKLIRQHQNKIDTLKGSRESLEIDINVRPQPYDYKEEFDRYKDTRGMRFVEGTKDVIDLGNVGSQEPVKHESNYISPSASHDTYTHNNHSNNWSSSNSSSNDSYSSSDSSSCDSGSSSGGCD